MATPPLIGGQVFVSQSAKPASLFFIFRLEAYWHVDYPRIWLSALPTQEKGLAEATIAQWKTHSGLLELVRIVSPEPYWTTLTRILAKYSSGGYD